MTTSTERSKRRIETLAWLLDQAIPIPVLNRRIGLDGLLSLIPFVGDAAGTLLSGYIMAEAARIGAPKSVLAKMGVNVLIDTFVGAIPIVGDLFDFAWKANLRNVRLLERHFSTPVSARASRRSNRLTITLVIAVFIGLLVLLIWLSILVLQWLWGVIAG